MNFHLSQDATDHNHHLVIGPDGSPAVAVQSSSDDARFILSVLNGDAVDFPDEATPGPWTLIPGKTISIVSEATGGSRLVATMDGSRTSLAEAIVDLTHETAPSPSF
jgi:hypothetical protein